MYNKAYIEIKNLLEINYIVPLKLQGDNKIYSEFKKNGDFYLLICDNFFIKCYNDYMYLSIDNISKEQLFNIRYNENLNYIYQYNDINDTYIIRFRNISYNYIQEVKELLLNFI